MKIEPEIEDFVKKKIADHKVVIFSKTYCTYCKYSKNVFHEIDSIYHAVELDKRRDGMKIHSALVKMTDNQKPPYVFVKGTYLAGGTNLNAIHELDKMRDMLDIPPPAVQAAAKIVWTKYDNPPDLPLNDFYVGEKTQDLVKNTNFGYHKPF